MVNGLPDINLKAIGVVRSEIKEPVRRKFKGVISEIVIDPALTAALDNLDEFSHIIVIYFVHRSRRPTQMKIHPRGDPHLPLTGLFATRSPNRPNPIGKTTVKLLARQGNVLKVEGLDAIDGTPVIDIKPYIPGYDSAEDARAPSWVTKH